MNKKLFFIVLFFLSQIPILLNADCTGIKACDCKVSSHTFFSIRPVFTVVSPEYLAHNRNLYREYNDSCGSSFQATILGGKSTHNDALARFFLPFCNPTIRVNELAIPGDILAANLNIYTTGSTFASSVEFKPHHSYAGVGLNYQKKFWQDCNGNGLWFSVSGPILRVHNRIEIIETISTTGGAPLASPALTPTADGCPAACPNSCNDNCILDPAQALPPVGSVTAAFAQPGWCFGRIDNSDANKKNHRKTRVGDITARIGYELVKNDCCHLDSFVGAIIPTGNRPKAIQMFEPMVGHNHHWGIVLGGNMGMQVWQNCRGDTTIYAECDASITDLFARNERRSFDLKYKPWSRYMQFYKNVAQAQLAANSANPTYALILHTPGIDILTQDLKVKPGFYRSFNGAFILQRCCFEVEVGYNFFARQAECVKLGKCEFPTGAALKDVIIGGGQTGRYQTINNNFGNNCAGTPVASFADNVITVDDLNLESAAHPAYLTHTLYGSFAYKFDGCNDYPTYFAVGGSYEFGPDNASLNRWMAWGKFGIAF